MDPITGTIDKLEEVLGHSPHPAIVALPVGAWTVSNICDGLYLLTGNDAYDSTAQVSMAIGLLGAAGAAVTGLRDYGYIPQDRQPSHDVATTHGLGNAAAGTLIMTSYVLRSRDRAAGYRTGLFPRLLSLAGGALSMYTAWLGGKLVQEYGEAVKPVMAQQDAKQGQLETGDRGSRQERGNNWPRGRRQESLAPERIAKGGLRVTPASGKEERLRRPERSLRRRSRPGQTGTRGQVRGQGQADHRCRGEESAPPPSRHLMVPGKPTRPAGSEASKSRAVGGSASGS